MEVMLFQNIYAKSGTITQINNLEEITSNSPKETCALYGAFVSTDKKRKLETIVYRTAITVDVDCINGDDKVAREAIQKVRSFCESNLTSWIIHETHSSQKDDRRIRVIIPIGKISTKNFPRLAKAFVKDLLDTTKLNNVLEIDRKTYEPQQLMYFIPEGKMCLGKLDGENNIDFWIEKAKEYKPPEAPKEKIIFKQTGGFYEFLSEIGMRAIIDNEFGDTYKFIRHLGNGEAEYKYLNSKKKSGVRITRDNQVIVSWHTGDPYMKETDNGVMASNIYHMLKARGLVDKYLAQYRLTKG